MPYTVLCSCTIKHVSSLERGPTPFCSTIFVWCVCQYYYSGGPRSFEGVRSSYFCGRARYSIEGRGPPHTILQLLPTVSSSTPAKSVPAHHSPTYNFYRGGELKVHVVSGCALRLVNIRYLKYSRHSFRLFLGYDMFSMLSNLR